MTAPTAAPASAPIAPAAPRAAPQPPADPFAFAAVLNSLPGAAAKGGDPRRREAAPFLKRPAAGRVAAWTAAWPFAHERRRAAGVLAVRLGRRLDEERTSAICR